ncbi:MAG: helix-hairpin-helix domain-containing protein [Halobacteriaceae archaeon]
MRNEEVADLLDELADFHEIEEDQYRARAFRNAADSVESLSEDVAEVYERGDLREIEGVGDSIAEKIGEYLETGELEYYQDLKDGHPSDVEALTDVEGVGPKTADELHQALGIETLEDLERAAREGEIASVEGFGEQTQHNILEHVAEAKEGRERTLLGRAFSRAEEIRARLDGDDAFGEVTVVGSFRRRRPTVGDVDVLATASDREAAMDAFCSFEGVREVLSRGETKSSVVVAGDLQVDLRVVDPASYGAALVYFTGSKEHNITLRDRAVHRDWKLNEYGLFDVSDVDGEDAGQRAGERLAGETEAAVYDALGCDWVPPELREDTGEVASATEGALPDLVERDDVRGDLQCHTDHSDGAASVREMAAAAGERGLEYLLVTDHGPELDVVGGLDDEEFATQREEVREVNEDGDVDVEVLHGVEAEVTEDGLGAPESWYGDVDLLVAAMHRAPEEPTDRLCEALAAEPVDVLAHPTNRKLLERSPVDLDLERVVDVAAEQDVALEINAQPARLDLDWRDVERFRDDAAFVVSTDAHDTDEFDFAHLGVAQARRGWLEADDVLNTRPLEDLLAFFD